MIAGYRIDAMMHRGAFAHYYTARAPGEDVAVVVRELFPEFVHRTETGKVRCCNPALADTLRFARRRFVAEGHALHRVDDPGLPHIFAVHEANGTAYWVLEPSRGERLAQILEQSDAVAPETIEHVALAMLSVLDRMHGAGVLHLDIHPHRILVDSTVTRLVGNAFTRFATHRFNPELTWCVPHEYAPLELHAPNEPGDPASDVYGLAATLYHMATGRPPPPAPARAEDKHNEVAEALDRAAHRVGRGLAKAIEDGLGLLVEDRPQSAAEWRSGFGGIA